MKMVFKMYCDWTLFPVKVHYFIFAGALACVLPFRTVFVKQLGVSATAVGVIFLAVPFLKIVTNPIIGYFIDAFKKFRLILASLIIIVAVSHLAMIYIPPIQEFKYLTKDFRTVIDYNSFLKDNSSESYFEIKSELPLPRREYQMSCKLACTSLSSTERKEAEQIDRLCSSKQPFQIETHVVFNSSACSSELSLLNDSLFFVNAGNRSLIRTTKQSPSSKHFPDSVFAPDPRCLHSLHTETNTTEISNKSGAIKSVLRFASDLNMFDKTPEHASENLFLIQNGEVLPPSCTTQLSCVTKDCRFENGTKVQTERGRTEEFVSFQFWTLFLLIAASSVCFSGVFFLVDAVCYEMLAHNRDRFGVTRLWGTVGWGLGALLGGYMNQILSTSEEVDYSLSFYLLVLLIVIDLLPVSKMKVDHVPYSSRIWKDVAKLVSRPDVAGNLLVVFVIGVLSGCIWNYQFWFMEEIGSSQLVMGLSNTVECLAAEVPCFLFSGWIIKKIGFSHCYDVTFLFFGLRYLCFAYMTDPLMSLPVALLHGPTFGLFYAAMTMYGKTEAPPGTEATVQALLSMSFEGIGVGVGSALGGLGFDRLGSRQTFMWCAIFSFVGLAVHLTPNLIHRHRQRRSKKSPDSGRDAKPEKALTAEEKIVKLSLLLKV